MSRILDLKTTTAYGVQIPNLDGRAGMVAIVVDNNNEVDLDKLRAGLNDKLPNYARPIFVRLQKEARMTSMIILYRTHVSLYVYMAKLTFLGTFKLQKNLLQQEGFDPSKIKDPIFFFDNKAGSYVRLSEKLYQNIVSGAIRL